MVLEWGGNEDVAIAALLHDAVEDQGGLETLAEIQIAIRRSRRGNCSGLFGQLDSRQDDKGSVARAQGCDCEKAEDRRPRCRPGDRRDKLHNLSAIVRDVRRDGPQTMSRFNATAERVVWYHGAVAEALELHRASTRSPRSKRQMLNSRFCSG